MRVHMKEIEKSVGLLRKKQVNVEIKIEYTNEEKRFILDNNYGDKLISDWYQSKKYPHGVVLHQFIGGAKLELPMENSVDAKTLMHEVKEKMGVLKRDMELAASDDDQSFEL